MNNLSSSFTFGSTSAGKKESKARVIEAVGGTDNPNVFPAKLVTVVGAENDGYSVLGMTTEEPTINGGARGLNKTLKEKVAIAGLESVTVKPEMFVISEL